VTPQHKDLLSRRLSRLRQQHGDRLVFDESKALKLQQIDKPMTLGAAYEELLTVTASALSDYCDQVRGEVETFVERTLPSFGEEDRDELLRAVSEQFDPELYLKRFDMFKEAIKRDFDRAGRQFDAKGLRLDILRARQQAGTSTGINRFLGSLRDDLDLRALSASSVVPVQESQAEQARDSLSKTAHDLLLDLYRAAASPRFNIDARSFRVRHHEQLSVLDEMVRRGSIRDLQGFYSPVLLALSQLDSVPEVRQLFDDCGVVVRALRERYFENQVDLIATEDLAQRASLPVDRFRRALFYLNDSVPLLAGSSGSVDSPMQMALPAEKLLQLKSVRDVLAEVRRYGELSARWAFPDPTLGPEGAPVQAVRQARQWLQHLPSDLQALLAEVYAAQESQLWILAVMGVRAAIDMTCNQLVGDVGGFDQKLQKLRSSGHVSEKQLEVLQAVVELGHASSHRGHVPAADDVGDVLDILERLLKAQYIDPRTKERLVQTTPPRRKIGPSPG
jgi:hypothetical protein